MDDDLQFALTQFCKNFEPGEISDEGKDGGCCVFFNGSLFAAAALLAANGIRKEQFLTEDTGGSHARRKFQKRQLDLESLNLDVKHMDPAWNRVYPKTKNAIWAKEAATNNQFIKADKPLPRGGKDYWCPLGWRRYGIKVPDFDGKFKDWCVCYHGTRHKSVHLILCDGLKVPGSKSEEINGQMGAAKPSIYVSPSITYSAAYSDAWEKDGKWIQIVFQVRCDPEVDKIQPETLRSLGGRQCDEHFSNSELEWLYYDKSKVQMYGIMLRKTSERPRMYTIDKA